MLVIAGGYEGGIMGIEVTKLEDSSESRVGTSDSEHQSYDISQVFKFLCTQGSIRCMASSDDLFSCGGTDETIQVYNLSTKRKHGELMLSSGCITALSLYGNIRNGMLIIGTELGEIMIYDTWNLKYIKTLKVTKNGTNNELSSGIKHKGGVSSLAMHADGVALIATYNDGGIRLWNMNTHLCIFYTKVSTAPIFSTWSTNGQEYIILTTKELFLSSTKNDDHVTYKCESSNDQFTTSCFVGNDIIIGTKLGEIIIFGENKKSTRTNFYKKRIKGIREVDSNQFLVGYSDGHIQCITIHGDPCTPSFQLLWDYNIEMSINDFLIRI